MTPRRKQRDDDGMQKIFRQDNGYSDSQYPKSGKGSFPSTGMKVQEKASRREGEKAATLVRPPLPLTELLLPSSSTPFPPDENNTQEHDPYNLIARFVHPQQISFSAALREIQTGQKQSCWMWFVLPTPPYIVDGIEQGSVRNRRYALRSDEEVMAYLKLTEENVNLRQNYLNILGAIRTQLKRGITIVQLLGPLDAPKALSSFRLFERIASKMEDDTLETLCGHVLDLAQNKIASSESPWGLMTNSKPQSLLVYKRKLWNERTHIL